VLKKRFPKMKAIVILGIFVITLLTQVECNTPRVFTDLEKIQSYLTRQKGGTSVDDAVPLVVNINLRNMTAENVGGWPGLLNIIDTVGKYVTLDLSNCTMAGTEFDANESVVAGKDLVVALVLPNVANSIAGTFKQFVSLASVSANNVNTIGSSAFSNCTALKTVDFPAATTIGSSAFFGCTAMKDLYFPVAITIDSFAFTGCTALKTLNLPVVTTIGGIEREDRSFPYLYVEVSNVFAYCTSLEDISLPAAVAIGGGAFRGCTSLRTIDLPLVASIGSYAFGGCTNLEVVNIPTSKNFPFVGFGDTGPTALTVTIGGMKEKISGYGFDGVSQSKNVTLRVLSNTSNFYGINSFENKNTTALNMGNAIRGRGWYPNDDYWKKRNNGYGDGSVNSKINLIFETY